jgi:carboxyl-terminal processing protease
MSAENKKNNSFYIKLPFILGVALSAGILIGATMSEQNTSEKSVFSSILKFREIVSYVRNDYVDEVDTDELVETAINAMLDKLDPHSIYIPAEDLELTKAELEGGFDGIGIEFSIIKDTIYVVSPLTGGPSEKLGIRTGDRIVTVDGENVAGNGITNKGVFERLRGQKGSKVAIEIKRKGLEDLLTFEIIRDKIPQHSVDVGYMINDEVGYIKINRFSATTYTEFKETLARLKEEGMKKLILDLQGNPGGYMDRAVDVVDELIGGNSLIVYTKGKESKYDSESRARTKGLFEKEPVIVLIDQGSASASEIVAGSLQDNDRALIVGRRSFGKGLVQRPIPLSDGSELRLTISRYYIPSGRSIQKPYGESDNDYNIDLTQRYENGELFSPDSIKIQEEYAFKTSKGRAVYGGGGIVPDYFVPLDTSGSSYYLTRLYNANAVSEYILKYYQKNKKKLESTTLEEFKSGFVVSDKMLGELVKTGEAAGVTFDKRAFERSKDLLKVQLKAQLARRVWDNLGFYSIFNETNEAFQKALTLFDKAEMLAQNYR